MTTQWAIAVEQLPFLTRAQALEEGEHDPGFWSYLARVMNSSDPVKDVDNEMKKAAINALAPSKYEEAGRRWPMLRDKIRSVQALIASHLYSTGSLDGLFDLSGMGYTDPVTGITTFGDKPTEPAAKPAGDIWSTIGSVISGVGTAAASIWTTRITTSAARSIANTQAGVVGAQTAAQQQIAQQQAQAALLAAQQTTGGGTGNVIMYVLLGLLGVGGLLFLMKSMKG